MGVKHSFRKRKEEFIPSFQKCSREVFNFRQRKNITLLVCWLSFLLAFFVVTFIFQHPMEV